MSSLREAPLSLLAGDNPVTAQYDMVWLGRLVQRLDCLIAEAGVSTHDEDYGLIGHCNDRIMPEHCRPEVKRWTDLSMLVRSEVLIDSTSYGKYGELICAFTLRRPAYPCSQPRQQEAFRTEITSE